MIREQKEVMHMQDFSRESYRLIPQYLPHYAKMMEDKDIDTRALMAEAFSVAVQVLARFDGIEPHEVVASVYVFCKDEKYKFISRYFESCVESAALTPDAFAKRASTSGVMPLRQKLKIRRAD